MIPTLINPNVKIKFTGRYSLITSPSTAIPERLPIKNICEILSHIFLYIFKFISDKNVYESFKFFEQIMHQKFDTIEELLKECNIENYKREFKEKETDEK